jgi:hypothetical protein
VLFALAALYPSLLNMDAWSYLVIVLVGVASLAIGYVAGPDDPKARTSLAIECAVRHPTVAITIAGSNFTPAKVIPVLFPCILTSILLGTIYLTVSSKLRQ